VVIWGLVVFGSYRYAERLFLLLALVFLTYPVAAVLAHPDWGEVAANAFWPHLSGSKEFLFLAVAVIGTTITPSCSTTRPPPWPTKASDRTTTTWSGST
jgi:Mn2+/Fe2+ NRAMP family transporter